MWHHYKNGNYVVLISDTTGTKIRYNKENKLIPDRPESMDIKITNRCNHGCLFCHESSVTFGKEASYENLDKFAKTVLPFTECAVGGGNLMLNFKHTQYFLEKLKEAQCFPSITVKQEDFTKYSDIIEDWYINNLIYGVGVSLSDPTDSEFQEMLHRIPTAVIHVIAGLFNEQQYNELKGKNFKILILGYKNFRRGFTYYNAFKSSITKNIEWLYSMFNNLEKDFRVVAFDNLALEQLNIKGMISADRWNRFYMGDDGGYTFYVDLVEGNFAKNSTSIERFSIGDKTVIDMFNIITKEYNDDKHS